MLGIITWAALAKYAVNSASGECYSALNEDILSKKGTAPNGFNWLALVQYWDAMGGNVPVPVTPPPVPVPPVPVPTGTVTATQVLAWLAAAFKTSPPLMFRNQALQVAQKVVATNWTGSKSFEMQKILKARTISVTDAEIEAVLKINKNPS